MVMIVVGLWLLIFAPLMCLPLLVQPGEGTSICFTLPTARS